MAISPDERRFLKDWEEQRKGGKASYVGVYTFGLFIMLYMGFVVLGLFAGLPFIKVKWLLLIGVISLVGAISLAFYLWRNRQRRFSGIIRRELEQLPPDVTPLS